MHTFSISYKWLTQIRIYHCCQFACCDNGNFFICVKNKKLKTLHLMNDASTYPVVRLNLRWVCHDANQLWSGGGGGGRGSKLKATFVRIQEGCNTFEKMSTQADEMCFNNPFNITHVVYDTHIYVSPLNKM